MKTKLTYERCEITTNLPGMTCPMCGAAITRGVTHTCSRPEKPAKKTVVSRRQAQLTGVTR